MCAVNFVDIQNCIELVIECICHVSQWNMIPENLIFLAYILTILILLTQDNLVLCLCLFLFERISLYHKWKVTNGSLFIFLIYSVCYFYLPYAGRSCFHTGSVCVCVCVVCVRVCVCVTICVPLGPGQWVDLEISFFVCWCVTSSSRLNIKAICLRPKSHRVK